MKRSNRILSTLVLLAALLSSQFAVAAYACPVMFQAVLAPSASVENYAATEDRNDLMPCDAPGAGIANEAALCRAHCDEGHANVGDTFAQLPIAFMAAFSVSIPPLIEIQNSRSAYASLGLQHALAPPHAITHCCLRL